MVHYVDDNDGDSNEMLCRSMLNMIALCRMSAARLKIQDQALRSGLLDALAVAETNIQQLMRKAQNAGAGES
jgi:hypothetical protein